MAVIEIEDLRKDYRRFRKGTVSAISGLDLEVPEGGVYGFLGPNGAGKTSTVRCLLGLVQATSGRCRILGADPQNGGLPSVIRRIGSIVETPMMFPGFSGRRNLQLLGRTYGIKSGPVDDALELVGLSDRAGDRVKTYSLGMKQRLGIAAALLKDPELLILDEPANGLDPAGIREVRELLRQLGSEGRTVFISSHILSEVRQTCDQVAILARGRCVASGSVEDVLASSGPSGLYLEVADVAAAAAALGAAGINVFERPPGLRVETPSAEAARVTKVLADAGHYVTQLRPDEQDLESVFLKLTEEPDSEVPA